MASLAAHSLTLYPARSDDVGTQVRQATAPPLSYLHGFPCPPGAVPGSKPSFPLRPQWDLAKAAVHARPS